MVIDENKIKLGDTVRCKLTGFEGFVAAIAQYMYGCTQMQVQPKTGEKGDWIKPQWIDEPQLDIMEKNPEGEQKPRFGGERNHP